jgi:branched-chain amino acid transport system ATP-binding protein
MVYPGEALLDLAGVSKRFGGLEALRNVTLGFGAGGIYGLIGPNGAGKTTMFNVVTGTARATTGSVRFKGAGITDLPPHRIARLGIARTYQLVRPFFELTAAENVEVGIAYGRGAGTATRSAIRAEARSFLELVGLADKDAHLAGELNLGERKRLEIARALAARPELLLFDEVLAGLNPTEVGHAVDLLRRVNQRGITILMIEHNMQAIMAACSHIFVLHHGELIAQGSPEHVSRDPAVVEAYLGRRDHRRERRRRGTVRA